MTVLAKVSGGCGGFYRKQGSFIPGMLFTRSFRSYCQARAVCPALPMWVRPQLSSLGSCICETGIATGLFLQAAAGNKQTLMTGASGLDLPV